MKRKTCSTALVVAGLLISVLRPLPLLAQSSGNSTEKPFVSGGRIEIRLEAGGYEVRPAVGDRIRVTWDGPRSKDVKVTLNTNGTHADLTVYNTPDNNFHAVIEVPATADLTIRLTAGDLRIGDIKGNKDIHGRAGDIRVNVSDPNDYRKVEASVNAGDINAQAFSASKGGLFRSFEWSGPGKYTLRVSLWAGDIRLR